jgi:hypothetical protein
MMNGVLALAGLVCSWRLVAVIGFWKHILLNKIRGKLDE